MNPDPDGGLRPDDWAVKQLANLLLLRARQFAWLVEERVRAALGSDLPKPPPPPIDSGKNTS